MLISYGPSVRGSVSDADLDTILAMIREEKFATLVSIARKRYVEGYADRAKTAKNALPIFCSGVFSKRTSPGQVTNRRMENFESCQCIVIDIDHIAPEYEAAMPQNPSAISMLYAAFRDEYDERWIPSRVYAAFRSPSGDGVKVVFLLDAACDDRDDFSALFTFISTKFFEEFGIRVDASCRDATRATFLSSDSGMYLNTAAKKVEFSEMRENFERVDAVDEDESIELKTPEQASIFVRMANAIQINHYKQFRDLCSAASRMGKEELTNFYHALLRANAANLTAETRSALEQADKYIASFAQEHNRVPLQYIIDFAVRQGYDLGEHAKKKGSGKDPMFDISRQITAAIDWMNERFCLFNFGDGIIQLPTSQWRAVDTIENKTAMVENTGYQIKRISSVREHLRNRKLRVVTEKGTTISMPYYDIWMASTRRREAHSMICDPRKPQGIIDRGGVCNEWRGFNVSQYRIDRAVQWEKENGVLACQPILDYIQEVLAGNNAQDFQMIIDWCTELVQNAGAVNKASVALALISPEEGTGKGTFDSFMRDLVGPVHSTSVGDMSVATGTYNQILQGKLLITWEEAVYSGDPRHASALLRITGSDDITIRPLFMPPYTTPNISRSLILSNHSHVIPVSASNRRYYIVQVSPRHKNDRTYFGMLRDVWVRRMGKESFFNFLKTRPFDINNLSIQQKEMSKIQRLNAISSLGKFDQWVAHVLRSGTISESSYASTQTEHLRFYSETVVSYDLLFADFCRFAKESGASRHDTSEAAFRSQVFHRGLAENRPGITTVFSAGGYRNSYQVTIPKLSELWKKWPLLVDGLVLPTEDAAIIGGDIDD